MIIYDAETLLNKRKNIEKEKYIFFLFSIFRRKSCLPHEFDLTDFFIVNPVKMLRHAFSFEELLINSVAVVDARVRRMC